MPNRRSVCPIACTLDVVGDKWTLLVLRDLFSGKMHFKEFAASEERIATNILTSRLERLLNHRLIKQVPSKVHAGRFGYRLTERGETMLPLLEAVTQWGLRHLDGTEIKALPSG